MDIGDKVRRKGHEYATHEIVAFRHGQGETFATLRRLSDDNTETCGTTLTELNETWEQVED